MTFDKLPIKEKNLLGSFVKADRTLEKSFFTAINLLDINAIRVIEVKALPGLILHKMA